MKQNIALIGAGYWGKNLARNFFEIGALHTICDSHLPTLTTYQNLYPGIFLSVNYKEVIENPRITAVVIATSTLLHYRIARDALLKGKDVFIEKPMCLCIEEAQELVTLAQERGCILMVGHILQYHPCFLKLRSLIEEGRFGTLQQLSSFRLNLGIVCTEENALWSFAPHDLSMLLTLIKDVPYSISCFGDRHLNPHIEDSCTLLLKFQHSITAQVNVSWMYPERTRKLTIIGSKGMAIFDDTQPWGQKLAFFEQPLVKREGSWVVNNAKKHYLQVEEKEPLKEECMHFVECINNRKVPRTDGLEGLNVLKILTAAQNSLDANGQAIEYDEVKLTPELTAL